MTAIAKAVIQNGELALRAIKHAEEYNIGGKERRDALPPMLETSHAKTDAA